MYKAVSWSDFWHTLKLARDKLFSCSAMAIPLLMRRDFDQRIPLIQCNPSVGSLSFLCFLQREVWLNPNKMRDFVNRAALMSISWSW